jgi:hypothetical protein
MKNKEHQKKVHKFLGRSKNGKVYPAEIVDVSIAEWNKLHEQNYELHNLSHQDTRRA